ncbi:MAG TPA: hypothetical protein PLR72_05470, partial [Paludibacteraceae bacterium]|nr:hypothetical protein [Paludibacteraceae bacterium]
KNLLFAKKHIIFTFDFEKIIFCERAVLFLNTNLKNNIIIIQKGSFLSGYSPERRNKGVQWKMKRNQDAPMCSLERG